MALGAGAWLGRVVEVAAVVELGVAGRVVEVEVAGTVVAAVVAVGVSPTTWPTPAAVPGSVGCAA